MLIPAQDQDHSVHSPARWLLSALQAKLLFVLALVVSLGCAFGQAVFVPNSTSNNVSAYLINPATGALSQVAGSPFLTGVGPVQTLVHPNGKLLYILESGSSDILAFAINAPSGVLTPISSYPATSPTAMAIDPAGQFLLVASLTSATITPYRINAATGDLAMGAAFDTGPGTKPVHLAIDPGGRFVYAAYLGTGQVAGFAVSSIGNLTPVPGSPFLAGSGPHSVAISSTMVLVANQLSGDISVYSFNSAGTLIQMGPAVPAGGSPLSVAVDPSGSYAFVANQLQVLPFSLIPNGPYALTESSPMNAGAAPAAVTVDPTGKFVYVADPISNNISGFIIGAFGNLTTIGSVNAFGAVGSGLLTAHHIGDTTAMSVTTVPAGPAAFGTGIEFKGSVADTLNPGMAPTGSVTFTVNGNAVPNGTAPLNTSGGFDFIFNAATEYLAVGSSLVSITYNPGSGFEAPVPLQLLFTVNKATPAFTIGYSPSSPVATQAMTLSVSAGQTADHYPTGSVTFSVDNTVAGSAVSLTNGSASVSFTPTTGNHAITLSYGGDGSFLAGSAGPQNFHAQHPTTTTLTSNSPTPVYGETPTLTAVVTSDGGVIGGTVTFYDGAVNIGSGNVISNLGVYSAQLSSYKLTSLGQHVLTAVYNGDTNNLPSNNNASPLNLTVSMDNVVVSSASVTGTLQYGSNLMFSASVSAASPGSGTPTGTVVFREGASTPGSGVLTNGSASFTTSTLAAGTHGITPLYRPDSNSNFNAGLATNTLTFTINQATPALTVTASPAAPVSGQPVTLSATLSQTGTATGTVDFSVNGSKIGSGTVSGNAASVSYTPPATGTYSITAVYNGDSNNATASNSTSLAVKQASVSVTTPSVSGTLIVGQPITFTSSVVAVSPGSGTPTGKIAFTDGSITMGGTGTILAEVAISAGSASFTISTLGLGSHTITGVYRGDTNFLSASSTGLQINIGQATPAVALTATPASAVTGQAVTLTATLSQGASPTGTVDFSIKGSSIGSAALNGSSAVLSYTPAAAGAFTVTSTYRGDTNNATANGSTTLTVNQDSVTVSTPTTSGTLTAGQAITFSAAVSAAAPGSGTPTGTMVFMDGTNNLGSGKLVSGVASVTVSTLGAGTHAVSASYAGDGNFLAGSSAALQATIAQATPMIGMSTSPASPAVFGQSVTVTATVSQGASPGGSVSFSIKGTAVGSATLNGNSAAITYSAPAVGSYAIVATYNGDANNASASASTTLQVNQAAVTVAAPSASATPTLGQPVTLTASVAAVAPGSGVPTGTITFSDGTTPLGAGTITVNSATITLPSLAVGPHSITAAYSGDANFAGAGSLATSLVIAKANPTITVSASPVAPFVFGQALTFTAALSSSAGVPWTGAVTFFDNGTSLTPAPVSVSGGTAAFGPYTLGTGSHAITAAYSGDANYNGVTSGGNPLTLQVNHSPVVISAGATSGVPYGKPVILSATVAPAPPATSDPTGQIIWMDSGVTLGTSTLASRTTSLSVSLAAGSHSIVLTYSGDGNFLSNSWPLTVNVAKASPVLTLNSTPASGMVAGQSVTLTATLNVTDATGSINFFDENGALNSTPIPLKGGTASISYTQSRAGSHTLAAEYSGDSNYLGASDRNTPLVLAFAQASTALGTPIVVGTATFGQQLTLTSVVSVAAPGSGTPTGAVVFREGGNALGTGTLSGGIASITPPLLAAGPHNITATYSGDANFAGSTSPTLSFGEDRAFTNTSLVVSQLPSSTTMTASVQGAVVIVPTGSVQFFNGPTLIGTVALTPASSSSAVATLTSQAIVGTVTAVYSGDSNLHASTSIGTQVSAVAKSTATISLQAGQAVVGQPTTLTVRLAWTAPSVPTGTIDLYDGQTHMGTVAAGSGAFFTANLSGGFHTILAAYSGDANYSASSTTYGLQVNRNTVSGLTISSNMTSAVSGEAVNLSLSLGTPPAAGTPAPTGQIQWLDGETLLATTPLANGSAGVSLLSLAPGSHQIAGAYSGDGNWYPGTSNLLTINVGQAPTVTTVCATAAATGSGGTTITATVTVAVPGSGMPTGSVQFTDAVTTNVLSTATLIGGLATALLPAGNNTATILAVYSGDSRFLPSSSAPSAQFAILNSASFQSSVLAPGEIATIFAAGLTDQTQTAQNPLPRTLGGVTVTLLDSDGLTHFALFFYVSPTQLSILIPGDTAIGPATLQISSASGAIISGAVTVAAISPGLFAANSNGKGVAAAQTIRVHADGTQDTPQVVATYDPVAQTWTTLPIDMSSPTDTIYLVLYGTGIQNATPTPTVNIQGQSLTPLYAGPQGTYAGLDQINVLLPPTLKGAGLVNVSVNAEGQSSNTVTLFIQ